MKDLTYTSNRILVFAEMVRFMACLVNNLKLNNIYLCGHIQNIDSFLLNNPVACFYHKKILVNLDQGAIRMLILTRRVGEVLVIEDDIKVHILGIKGNQVRIGIDAPEDVSVHREEIYLKIQENLADK